MPAKLKKNAAKTKESPSETPEAAPMDDVLDTQPMGGTDKGGDIPVSERRDSDKGATYKRSIYALPVNVQVVIGTARPTIAELLKLKNDSILEMDKAINDPVDLCIDNRIIARGELVETDAITGNLGLKITEIVDIAEDVLS